MQLRGKNNLPDKIRDKIEFVNIGREKLVVYRAMARAAMKKGDMQVRKEVMAGAQALAEDLLDTEVSIGETIKSIPDKKASSGGGTRSLPEGITKKQSHFFQTLADNKDLVEKVKAQARDNDDLPTRTAVLILAKEKTAIERKIEKIKSNSELPEKKYMLIYADPPWQYDKTEEFKGQDVERHYQTMTEIEICSMQIQKISADDCVLYLWSTAPKLNVAMRVMDAWGFDYKTCMVWDKIKHNMGFYASIRHELLLIGGKGSAKPDDLKAANQTDSVQSIERTSHSKKPEIFYEILERLHTHKNKIELFARSKRDGWDSWGNQI